ncbi:MAG: retropepsin-like domain-containing protein [Bacteroidales bacterium]|nr:retropepsin-like domain-containing protein [Bacteroidales bacterium]
MITKIPLQLINLKGDGFHLALIALINHKKAFLILDTGASRTVFDINRMSNFSEDLEYQLNEEKSTGLGTNTMESNVFMMDSFGMGDMEIKNYEAVAIDMTHINQTYEMLKMSPIDGVLGGDIMMDFKANIDYKTMTLSLNFAKLKYFKGK